MSPYQRSSAKQPNTLKASNQIADIWETGLQTQNSVDPPKPNMFGSAPYTRLIYHIDDLNNLFKAIAIDSDAAGYIQKKSPFYSETKCTRELISLTLMGFRDVFTVSIWIIPVFQDGVLVSQLYAADDENQLLILKYRNPVKMSDDDYSPI